MGEPVCIKSCADIDQYNLNQYYPKCPTKYGWPLLSGFFFFHKILFIRQSGFRSKVIFRMQTFYCHVSFFEMIVQNILIKNSEWNIYCYLLCVTLAKNNYRENLLKQLIRAALTFFTTSLSLFPLPHPGQAA